jgi:hypothetical protein
MVLDFRDQRLLPMGGLRDRVSGLVDEDAVAECSVVGDGADGELQLQMSVGLLNQKSATIRIGFQEFASYTVTDICCAGGLMNRLKSLDLLPSHYLYEVDESPDAVEFESFETDKHGLRHFVVVSESLVVQVLSPHQPTIALEMLENAA